MWRSQQFVPSLCKCEICMWKGAPGCSGFCTKVVDWWCDYGADPDLGGTVVRQALHILPTWAGPTVSLRFISQAAAWVGHWCRSCGGLCRASHFGTAKSISHMIDTCKIIEVFCSRLDFGYISTFYFVTVRSKNLALIWGKLTIELQEECCRLIWLCWSLELGALLWSIRVAETCFLSSLFILGVSANLPE